MKILDLSLATNPFSILRSGPSFIFGVSRFPVRTAHSREIHPCYSSRSSSSSSLPVPAPSLSHVHTLFPLFLVFEYSVIHRDTLDRLKGIRSNEGINEGWGNEVGEG